MTRTILVVDDDPDIGNIVQIALESSGYQVSVVNQAVDAVEWLKHRLPDLIVLDLMMPGMNGIQFAEQVRERGLGPNVPILVLSAASQVLYKAGWIEADGCLEKPFSISGLLEKVAQLTGPARLPRLDATVQVVGASEPIVEQPTPSVSLRDTPIGRRIQSRATR
jgi:DNA-binding response OmpR family regulator